VEPDAIPIFDADDVYGCRTIAMNRDETTSDGRILDYALVQLDRPVAAPYRPAQLSIEESKVGDPLTVIGYPNGIPVKIDSGARLLQTRESSLDYLSLSSDTFVTSSGSGVFDERGGLVAALARGQEDYEVRQGETCRKARRVLEPSGPSAAEEASYARPAIDDLCGSGWRSEPLCGRSSVCGDDQCSVDEHSACPLDCPVVSSWQPTPWRPEGCDIAGATDHHHRGAGPALATLTLCLWAMRARGPARALKRAT
jgi:hypothetical protein